MKFVDASTLGYTLEPGIYEVSDFNFMLKSLLPRITIDDIRLRSNVSSNETIRFTKNCFIFYTILGFTQNRSRRLSDIQGFVQLIPGTYKSEKTY